MSDYGLFWNSRDGDRKYNADDFATWLKKFFTTGVFNGDLFVSAAGGMTVNVGSGYANVDGKVMFFGETQSFTLDIAHSTLPRVDTIVVEADYAERIISCKVVKGEPGGSATPPERDTNVYQLVLAQIAIRAGATQITQANITDTRLDPSLCGYVAGTVDELEWDQITAQWETYLSEFQSDQIASWNAWITAREGEYDTWTDAQKALWLAWIADNEAAFTAWQTAQESDFETWFDHYKDIIDDSAAAHIQTEIDNIVSDLDDNYYTKTGAGERFDYKSSWITNTISVANWINNTYSFESLYPSTDYDILDIMPIQTATEAQRIAWSEADCGGHYETNVIEAHGVVPLIDIPVTMCIRSRV